MKQTQSQKFCSSLMRGPSKKKGLSKDNELLTALTLLHITEFSAKCDIQSSPLPASRLSHSQAVSEDSLSGFMSVWILRMGTGRLPGIIWVLSVLVTPGGALTCKVCTTANAKFCNASSVVCPEDHVCASSYTLTNTHGAIFSMSCSPRHHCDAPGSISASSGRLRRSTTCCDTDNCTPPPPTLPDDIFQPNGLTCQTCLSVSSKWCSSMHTIDCTGEEDACLLQTSQYYAPIRRSAAVRGCATKSICSLGTQRIEFGTLKMKFKYSCVFAGSTHLQNGLVAPLTVALAVVKYFSSQK